MSRDSILLNEGVDYFIEIDLNESNVNKGLIKFRGKLSEAEVVNKNKRLYPYAILDENMQRLMDVVKSRGLIGELDHPADSIIHFKEASHVLTKLYWQNNVLMGEGEILSTPHGRILKALTDDGIRWGMSSRGIGSGKVNENGVLVIGDNYRLITFDAVADPSCHEAFQEKVSHTKESFSHRPNYVEKNKDSRIYNVSKEAVIAAFGGIIKQQTGKLKARI